MTNERRISITIMADYGSAYLWVTSRGPANNGEFESLVVEDLISEALHVELEKWQRGFELAPLDSASRVCLLDWQQFNAQGQMLAQRVKRQLGPNFRVFYEKPYEDPNTQDMATVELHDDSVELCCCGPRWLHSGRAVPTWLPEWIVGDAANGVSLAALDWAIGEAIPHRGFTSSATAVAQPMIGTKYLLDVVPVSASATTLNLANADAVWVVMGKNAHAATCFVDTVVSIPSLYMTIDTQQFVQQRRQLIAWLLEHKPRTLLITGPSDTVWPEGYLMTSEFLFQLLPQPAEVGGQQL